MKNRIYILIALITIFSVSCCSCFDDLNEPTTQVLTSSAYKTTTSSFETSFTYLSSSLDSSSLLDMNPSLFPSKVFINNNEAKLIFTGSDNFTQGMCVFDDGLFLTQCSTSDGDYHISKIKHNGDIIDVSSQTFNHANGMSYDCEQQKIYVCKFAAKSGTDFCDRSCDFSFYIVDANTLEIEKEIDLFDVVKSVCPDSIGIGGIAFNNVTKKLCVLTRKPQRFVIFLKDDYSYDSSFYICEDNGEVLFGDICFAGDYVLTCYWDWDWSNTVSFYDLLGNNVKNLELYGMTHIESIDYFNNCLFANFNDFSNYVDTRVYAIEPRVDN